ncbi:hypothetical protein AAFC00_001225 [Neodothiora populina]|uniref:Uncharacterized protein n=1 Tax=Neodothiora populina TaxID=2781224 RepID=A0ABR3PN90_9PEZI
MTLIPPIKSLVIDLPPSCIEFCLAAPECFVIGTYFLEKKDDDLVDQSKDKAVESGEDGVSRSEGGEEEYQTRTGSLLVYRLVGDEIQIQQTLPTPYAILDLHFSPHDPNLLAVAGSTGVLELFVFAPSNNQLNPYSRHQLFDPSVLVLSLAWHTTRSDAVGVTASDGGVYTAFVSSASSSSSSEKTGVRSVRQIHCHELEAWTLAFEQQADEDETTERSCAVFSGGDDAVLRFTWPVALPLPPSASSQVKPLETNSDNESDENQEDENPKMQYIDRRIHNAGVTAILPLPGRKQTHITITGSYDDHIRVVHTPVVGRKVILAEENLGGGVWRLKMLEQRIEEGRFIILASCMHAGTRIVEITRPSRTPEGCEQDDEWTIQVLARFEEHKSMNYGSDVQPLSSSSASSRAIENGGRDVRTIVSTSFYDRLVCLWKYPISL